ncbi:MAG: glycosyltransferase, partial [Oscillospiraceae bacterium]|nr:glycosyltransferase [Oscillospiraceae bacterium]
VNAIAEIDERVKVVANPKNLGTMLNRKSGIDVATGDYIMFLDGDDYYSEDACEKAYNAIVSEGVDALHFVIRPFAEEKEYEDTVNDTRNYLKTPEYKITVANNGDLLNKAYTKEKISLNALCKIYKVEVAKQMAANLPENRLNLREDVLQAYLLLFFAKSYSYIPDELYNYRVGIGISTIKSFSNSRLSNFAKAYYVYKWLRDWTEKKGASETCAEILEELRLWMLESTVSTILQYVPKQKMQWYADIALQHCPVDEFIAYMSYLVYGKGLYSERKCSEVIRAIALFKSKKGSVKTVGTFYHRMHNGGVEKVISLLSDIWHDKGYKVVLFTDEAPSEADYPLNSNTVRVVLPTTNLHTFNEYLARTKAWISAIKEYNIDIMVYHAWENLQKLSDILAVKSTGIPFTAYTHGIFCSNINSVDFSYSSRAAQIPFVYQCIDAMVSLSAVDVAWWQSKGLRCYKTANPIQIGAETPQAAIAGKNVLISARIDRGKQIDDTIEILNLVKKEIPDVKFIIIGGCDDIAYKNLIDQLIDRYHLADNVEMPGYVKDVLPYYQNADILLSTSKFEGFGLSLMESKVCGLPLVCYYLPNLDISRNPKGMINVAQGDIYGAADAIIKILSEDSYKKELGRQARESGIEYISQDIGAIWESIFEDIGNNVFEYADDISVKDPLVTATNILVDFIAEGIATRGTGGGYKSEDLIFYQSRCNSLDQTIKEIKNSTAYKIGMAITSFPRKIKSLIKR